MDDEIWYLISNWFIYYYVNVFEELDTKRLFRDFVSRLFRSFATLVSWLRVTLALWFYHAWNVFVDSRYAWTVFVVSRYAWTVFVYSSYAWNVFVVSSYAWTVFIESSYAWTVFVDSGHTWPVFVISHSTCFVVLPRLFRDFVSRLFRGFSTLVFVICFCDFVSRLIIYPRGLCVHTCFLSRELCWFSWPSGCAWFVYFELRLFRGLCVALVIRFVSGPL